MDSINKKPNPEPVILDVEAISEQSTELQPEGQPDSKTLYSVSDVASLLGVSDRSIHKYVSNLEEIYFWCASRFKSGAKITEEGLIKCREYQQAVSTRVPEEYADTSTLLRQKVNLIPNKSRIGLEAYKQLVWEREKVDVDESKTVDCTTEVYDPSMLDREETAMAHLDHTQSMVAQARKDFVDLGQRLGYDSGTLVADAFAQTFDQIISAMLINARESVFAQAQQLASEIAPPNSKKKS